MMSMILSADDVAIGQWDKVGDQYAMRWKLRWRVWTVMRMRHSSGSQWSCLRSALEENGGRERWFTTTLASARRTRWRRAVCFKAVPYKTRRALGVAHVPPTKVFWRLTASVNETIVKPRVATAVGRKNHFKTTPRCSDQYVYVGFSRRKTPRSMAYTIAEKAIRFWHPNYNSDRAQS